MVYFRIVIEFFSCIDVLVLNFGGITISLYGHIVICVRMGVSKETYGILMFSVVLFVFNVLQALRSFVKDIVSVIVVILQI